MRYLGYTVGGLALAAFFAWVLIEMAVADDSVFRLVKLGAGTLGVLVLAGLVYLLLRPLGKGGRGLDA